MIRVDGSQMEGGGQLLRMATTYSCIMGEPVEVYDVRGNRKNPGLRPQHLATLKAAARLCSGKLTGAQIGSKEITLEPKDIKGGEHHIDIGTAGSISLMLQCLAPITFFAEKSTRLYIDGGTDVNWSPPTMFLENVFYPLLGDVGVDVGLETRKHGFYPKGGGKVSFQIDPVGFISAFTPGKPVVESVSGLSICGRLPPHVAERQAKTASSLIHHPTMIDHKTVQTHSPGSAICLWVVGDNIFMGSDSLGERGKPAEKVGSEAANTLLDQIKTGANVDKHTADHLILPCSLAVGESRFRVSEVTLHMLTAVELARMFTDTSIRVDGKLGKPGTVTVQGIGYRN